MAESEPTIVTNEMACKSCGAILKFNPGTSHLKCQYCQAENEIEQSKTEIVENNLDDFIAKQSQE